jgi:endonuclease/exonuclease/phosphatase family metal-dependent hydrolase
MMRHDRQAWLWQVCAITLGAFLVIGRGASLSAASTTPYLGTPAAIPGQINAENFDNGGEGVAYHDTTAGNSGGQYRNTDVDIEQSSEGAYDVGWIAAGEWLNYTVNVAPAGSYVVQLRVASPEGATMHVGFNSASSVWKTLSIPATGGWQNWTTVSLTVTLGAGVQQMTLLFDTGAMNFEYARVTSASAAGVLSPFTGTPAGIPGTIEAENFDNGGEGVAYHDTTPGNAGGQYRSTDVDIEQSSEGGYDVGWIVAGEWLNYTVAVQNAGVYTVQLRVASPSGASMHVGFNAASNVWVPVSIPATGGWQNWTTVSLTVTLGAGVQQMTLLADTTGFNLNYVTVAAVSGSGGSGSGSGNLVSNPSAPHTHTVLPVIEWNIEINDNSEAHARLAMDMLAGSGPRPQVVVIEEAYQQYFNVYIDELQQQTGQQWYGAFATHCAVGNWNGSGCSTAWYQGVGIFSTYPIVNSSSTLFPYADCWTSARAGLRAAINVNGTTVQVFATHLQTGGCTNDMQSRDNSMGDLKAWAGQFSTPQLAAGDFNADPDQIDTTSGMSPNFVDSWFVVGTGSRFTAFAPTPTMKIDYWFSDASGAIQPVASAVLNAPQTVSDHYPIQATFVVP